MKVENRPQMSFLKIKLQPLSIGVSSKKCHIQSLIYNQLYHFLAQYVMSLHGKYRNMATENFNFTQT